MSDELQYWKWENLKGFLAEHDLVVTTGLGPRDEVVITGRGRELAMALTSLLDLEARERRG